jgi:hypothetical protein
MTKRTEVTLREQSLSLREYFAGLARDILTRLEFIGQVGLELKKSTAQILSIGYSMVGELQGLRSLIMRLERPFCDEYFILEDFTGKAIPIHFRTVTSWDAFNFILIEQFKGRRGARRISQGRYVIKARGTHREISRSLEWTQAFSPNQKVEMSLVCKEFGSRPTPQAHSVCPRCQALSPSGPEVVIEWSVVRKPTRQL